MLGVVSHATTQYYTFDSTGEELSISQSLIAFSGYHFFGQNIGDGWYARGDLGLSSFTSYYNSGTTDNFTSSSETDFGFGTNLGGGYGFRIGTETRMTWGAHIGYLTANANNVLNVMTSLGFIF